MNFNSSLPKIKKVELIIVIVNIIIFRVNLRKNKSMKSKPFLSCNIWGQNCEPRTFYL